MSKFFTEVGWILLGVVFGVIALILYYYAFMNLVSGSWGLAMLFFIGGIVFTVMSIVAFRRKPS